MQTIAVLGANGRLSNAAARAFHTWGYKVIAITRSGKANGLPPDIERRAANAMDRAALTHVTQGADFIFNGLNPPYPQWKKLVMPLGENVIAAAKAHGAVHLFPGNVYNYGRSVPAHVDTQTPQKADTGKGEVRVRLERFFERQAQSEGVQTIILRAGDFFGGPVTGSWFDLVIAKKIAKGVFTYPASGQIPHSWAYLPDLAETFVRLAGKSNALELFTALLFPGHTLTGDELHGNCEVAMGVPLRTAGVPWPLLRLGGLVVPMLREVSEMAYLWQVPHSLDGTALEAVIGKVPHTNAQTAVAAALADLGFHTAGSQHKPAAALAL